MGLAKKLQRRYNQGSSSGSPAATKGDLDKLRRELDSNLRSQNPSGQGQSGAQISGRAIRMAKRGLGNIGKSLNTPYDKRRPKISQMPQRRRDMRIVTSVNLDRLKHPNFRKRDISGKKLK